ncbi:MAG TPA: acetylxylan esterase, partial [Clostridia bacterium]|nr:acetylxylan esterase [Clostridia bacterium]
NDSLAIADGVLVGDATFSQSDKKEGNYSLALDGTGDYVEVPDNDALDVGSDSFTISVWAKRVSDGGNFRLISKAEGPNRKGYEIVASNSGVFAYLSDGTTRLNAQKTGLAMTNWTHIVLRVDRVSNEMKLYINSTEAHSVSIAEMGTNSLSNSRPLRIGADSVNQVAEQFWNGNIDDVRLYKRLLTPNEIESVYKNGIPDTLTGYYKFNGGVVNSNNTVNTATTVNGDVTFNTDDKKEGTSSIRFGGTNGYVQIADNDAFDMGSENFSIAFWIKRTGGGRVISKAEGAQRKGYEVIVDGGNIYLWLSDGTTRLNQQKVPVNLNDWKHIVYNVDRDSNKIITYVDSVRVNEFDISALGSNSISNGRFMRIGADSNPDNAGSFFGGKLDDLRIEKRLLSASEITDIYNGGQAESTAALKELKVNDEAITGFDKNQYKYQFYTDVNNITAASISALPANSASTVTKEIATVNGVKKAVIRVNSSDGLSSAVYEIELKQLWAIENLSCTVGGENIAEMLEFPALENMTVSFQVYVSEDTESKVIIAIYDANNDLSSVKIYDANLTAAEPNPLSYNDIVLPDISAGKIKVMLFYDLVNIKPLVPAKEIFVPWQSAALSTVPNWSYTTDFEEPGVRSIYYDGMNYKGSPTKIFAYLGIPETTDEKLPGVVLVHGGGGTAYADWVRKWNSKGYAAIAMDLEGHTPDGQSHSFSGPQRVGFFGDLNKPMDEQWAYHANTAIILANNLLRSFSNIDNNKIGIAGISWGGILTSISAGADGRFAFAIPTYGCGYIHETPADGNFYYNFAPGSNFDTEKYLKIWEPSNYLSKANMPFLWVNSDHDSYFPLPIFSKSYQLTQNHAVLSIHPDMGHNHPIAWNVEEPYVFADSVVKSGSPLTKIISVQPSPSDPQKIRIDYQMPQGVSLDHAQIIYTADVSSWTSGIVWNTLPLSNVVGENAVEAVIDPSYKAYYFNLVGSRGLTVSSSLFVKAE